jgi:hypothetical protein
MQATTTRARAAQHLGVMHTATQRQFARSYGSKQNTEGDVRAQKAASTSLRQGRGLAATQRVGLRVFAVFLPFSPLPTGRGPQKRMVEPVDRIGDVAEL